MEKKYALITGATGGLGKAFVYETAKKGYSLLLTGRSQEKLTALREELSVEYPDVEARLYAADLSSMDSRKQLMEQIAQEGLKISLLVNVAGADIQKGLMSLKSARRTESETG